MKIKNLWPAAAGLSVGASLLATVLTSCSAAKIDDDLKITLDDHGNLVKATDKFGGLDYKKAIQEALKRSDTWNEFKEALAEEIVLNYFEDRADDGKEPNNPKNKEFKDILDEVNHDVDKDYNDLVQSCKNKYGASYGFYLQNENLSPNGGTEASYKRIQKLKKIKDKFISKVWDTSFFGYCKNFSNREGKQTGYIYPRAFDKDATGHINEQALANPATWDDLGFYAHTDISYYPEQDPESKDASKFNFRKMAAHPEGDYATIQQYTFDRWFDTEKPFFSAASLFKYSKPYGDRTLKDIYATDKTATIPDDPNETYPFFGGCGPEDKSNGTKIYYNWLTDLKAGNYLQEYTDASNDKHSSNGTVNIPCGSKSSSRPHTEDSQTLLLAYANKMTTEESGASLYVPYACAAAQLYLDAIGVSGLTQYSKNSRMNEITAARLEYGLQKPGTTGRVPLDLTDLRNENFAVILKNFFFSNYELERNVETGKLTPRKHESPAVDFGNQIKNINSFVDLQDIYDHVTKGSDAFHSDVFKTLAGFSSDFGFFFGKTDGSTSWGEDEGVRFLTNAVLVNDLEAGASQETQPWILELNESGMHAQTIDGYNFIKNPQSFGGGELSKKQAAKNVLKYRLMQKKDGHTAKDWISTDIFSKDGELQTYFKNNFANIILEMALDTTKDFEGGKPNVNYINIFRPIEKYAEETFVREDQSFFDQKIKTEFGTNNHLEDYIKVTTEYDNKKRIVDLCAAANKRIYAYRKDQITNSKNTFKFKKIYSNGLIAPTAYECGPFVPASGQPAEPLRMHDYACVNATAYFNWDGNGVSITDKATNYSLGLKKAEVDAAAFITEMSAFDVDADAAFSPQIKSAKAVMSNRFWYHSLAADRAMYKYMGISNGLSNVIKGDAYDQYIGLQMGGTAEDSNFDKYTKATSFAQAITSVYKAGKVMSDPFNYADVDAKTSTDYFGKIGGTYDLLSTNDLSINGKYSDFANGEKLFKATLTYLMLDSKPLIEGGKLFGNFYKILDSKISENEQAIIGYISKDLSDLAESGDGFKDPTTEIKTDTATEYDWTANVDNIYDRVGYASGTIPGTDLDKESKIACDQYWNILNKVFTIKKDGADPTTVSKVLAGFTGLQTATSSSLPSCLIDPAFKSVDSCTDNSRNLCDLTAGGEAKRYEEHTGAWYSFTGSQSANGQPITFEIKNHDGTKTITQDDFVDGYIDPQGENRYFDATVCRRLVKKIASYSSIDDLRELARKLADTHAGSCFYSDIAEKKHPYDNIDDMKYEMAAVLPRFRDGVFQEWNTETRGFVPCFERLSNVEIHEAGVDGGNKPYCFEDDTNNSYRLMLTQISKADITEKTLAPHWNGTTWVQDWDEEGIHHHCPITPEEFFYLLCQTANDASTQSIAITQIVKNAFGSEKMIVYDANVYNAFNSVWIKDWVKKPMGS